MTGLKFEQGRLVETTGTVERTGYGWHLKYDAPLNVRAGEEIEQTITYNLDEGTGTVVARIVPAKR